MKGGTGMTSFTPSGQDYPNQGSLLTREALMENTSRTLHCSLDVADQLLDFLWRFAGEVHRGGNELRFQETTAKDGPRMMSVSSDVLYFLRALFSGINTDYAALLKEIRDFIQLPDSRGTIEFSEHPNDRHLHFVLTLNEA